MNDPFEEQLRALRPGKLPEALRGALDLPPSPHPGRRVVWVAFATAAAACLAILLWKANAPSPSGTLATAPVFAGQRSSRVTEVRPLSVITDGSNQVWKMMEVNWVEEDTLVSATHPVAAQKQDHYRTLIPVAVHFD